MGKKQLGGVLQDGGEYFQISLYHSRLQVAHLRLYLAKWPDPAIPLDGLAAYKVVFYLVVLVEGSIKSRPCVFLY